MPSGRQTWGSARTLPAGYCFVIHPPRPVDLILYPLAIHLFPACSSPAVPPIPHRPIEQHGLQAGVHPGRFAGGGKTTGLPSSTFEEQRAFREAMMSKLVANGTVLLPRLGRLKTVENVTGSQVVVVFEPSKETRLALLERRMPKVSGPYGSLLQQAFEPLAGSAVYVEGFGWFAISTMPAFQGHEADGTPIDLPERQNLHLRVESSFTEELLRRTRAAR